MTFETALHAFTQSLVATGYRMPPALSYTALREAHTNAVQDAIAKERQACLDIVRAHYCPAHPLGIGIPDGIIRDVTARTGAPSLLSPMDSMTSDADDPIL